MHNVELNHTQICKLVSACYLWMIVIIKRHVLLEKISVLKKEQTNNYPVQVCV